MFPQSLIDQWLSKSREGRRSVQEDPKATPAILESIHQLEVYCTEHPYEVFCASSLRDPPLSLYALEGEEEETARLARPPAVFATTSSFPAASPIVASAAAAQAQHGGLGGLGGRYAENDEKHRTAAAAADHLRGVVSRLTAYLQSSGVVSPAHGAPERAAEVAQWVVQVLAEAAVVAAVRTGVGAQVEAEEAAAAHRRRQQRRRLQLHLWDSHGACAAHETSASTTAMSTGGASREEDGGAELEVDYVAARPIAEYRRDCQGLLSMAGLLFQSTRDVSFTVGGAGDEGAAAPRLSEKRTRSESNVSTNGYWTRLREDGLRHLFGDAAPPAPPVAVAAEARQVSDGKASTASTALPSAEGWAGMHLQITERDVLFALRKVFPSTAA
ncbi:hypothetical protein N2W54_004717 [Lotmaria passim]